MEKNLDITNPPFNEQIWPVPSDFVKSRFHCTLKIIKEFTVFWHCGITYYSCYHRQQHVMKEPIESKVRMGFFFGGGGGDLTVGMVKYVLNFYKFL